MIMTQLQRPENELAVNTAYTRNAHPYWHMADLSRSILFHTNSSSSSPRALRKGTWLRGTDWALRILAVAAKGPSSECTFCRFFALFENAGWREARLDSRAFE
ncbi:hypothetical protein ANO14919_078310 [Xylariales sp. No.14919]|nr:hypothetical protein ANO14919_078310 [Xylariales sp. No.14919]